MNGGELHQQAQYEATLARIAEHGGDGIPSQAASAPGGRTRDAREQIARALHTSTCSPLVEWEQCPNRSVHLRRTDAVLAVPAVADAVADYAAVERVLDLHRPIDRGTGPQCEGCATHVTFTPWPCKTIRALDGGA